MYDAFNAEPRLTAALEVQTENSVIFLLQSARARHFGETKRDCGNRSNVTAAELHAIYMLNIIGFRWGSALAPPHRVDEIFGQRISAWNVTGFRSDANRPISKCRNK